MSAIVEARKIAEIGARVARVRELLPADVATFLADRTRVEALILNLYLALQATADLALHAVGGRGLGLPGNPRDALGTLVKAGLLDAPLAARLGAAVGLRNRIAHQYGTLDLALVFEAARDDLGDLERFAACAAAWPDA